VVMKNTIFWDIMLCSPLKVNRRFAETYRLHLQGRKISQARNQRKRWFLVPPKRQLTFNGLHGLISQQMVPFVIILPPFSLFQSHCHCAEVQRAQLYAFRPA
jgi:hypothetical protein